VTSPKRSAPQPPLVLVVHGPNLNLLGTREPHLYGKTTLAEIDRALVARGAELGLMVEPFQSNHEGALIDRVQRARGAAAGLIVNAGGLTHTSVSLRDAIAAIAIPTVEVHLSNLYAREDFRHRSLLSPVCLGQIVGLGAIGYRLALDALAPIVLGPEPASGAGAAAKSVNRARLQAKSRAATSSKKGAASR
jgi:3-dehydroquinate dehydratase-2